jgi:hypothetical protein
MNKIWLYAGAALLTTSCSSTSLQRLDQRSSKALVAQICVPGDTWERNNPVWVSSVKQHSSGDSVDHNAGTTLLNQPVFEAYTAKRRDVVAIVVMMENTRGTHHVFVPPESVPIETWTSWQSAKYSTQNSWATHYLLRGKEIPDTFSPDSNAPRLRYRLMDYMESLNRIRAHRENGIETGLPSC